jgi:hypothetical protein
MLSSGPGNAGPKPVFLDIEQIEERSIALLEDIFAL